MSKILECEQIRGLTKPEIGTHLYRVQRSNSTIMYNIQSYVNLIPEALVLIVILYLALAAMVQFSNLAEPRLIEEFLLVNG